MFFDTHVHLNSPQLYPRYVELIHQAAEKQVTHMVIIGYDFDTSQKAISIAEQFPHIYAAVGVHPTEVLKSPAIDALVTHPKVVAIGEIGFDYYWQDVPRETQAPYFQRQIELAHHYQKPIIIHMRDATEDTYQLLLKNQSILHGGIMHCYSGSAEMVPSFLNLGFHISFGGPVTFLNAKTPKQVAQMVPLDRLLIETDSPYLAPHPFRGKENVPANVPLVAQAIADLRHMSVLEVAHVTMANAKRLFNV